jgi:hypothetical protein
MAGLIAGAEIMIGGRTPHPYHTRPGMVRAMTAILTVSPPGRCRAGTIPALPQGPGELVRVARRRCGHAGQARGHAQSPTRRARSLTAGAALATAPADWNKTGHNSALAPTRPMTGHTAPRGAMARLPPLPAMPGDCTGLVRLDGPPQRRAGSCRPYLHSPLSAIHVGSA